MGITINKGSKRFDNLIVFDNFNITIPDSKITCILGPSGCGKTTLLNIISGLLSFDSGNIYGLEDKSVSYLFQEPRLLKWKTVWENIDFVLKDIYTEDKRQSIIKKYIDIVGLSGFEKYYPHKLSGGMEQRVAVARAFAYPSQVLIMDEPFKAIDLRIKISLMESFIKLWNEDNRTVIFVTHDIAEAVFLGDQIYLLQGPPAIIKKKFTNNILHSQRRFKDNRTYEIEKEIYELIVRDDS